MVVASPVIILGMHRSGTSCLTGCLQEAGLLLGEVNLKTRCNEKGTRENVAIMALNDAVLASVGAAWNNPPAEQIAWTAEQKARRDNLISKAGHSKGWGFKDPRTLLTLDGWLDALPDARFIATFRDPFAVARSLSKRNDIPIEEGLALWKAYNEKLLAVCQTRDVAVVNYDWRPETYRQGLNIVCAAANLSVPPAGFKFFETRLRRNESVQHADLPPPLRTIHQQLRYEARRTLRTGHMVGRSKTSTSAYGTRPGGAAGRPESEKTKELSAQFPATSNAKRIEELQQTMRNGDVRPGLCDDLGHLLAQENRWAEADAAYRAALDARCRQLGFRSEGGTAQPQKENEATAQHSIGEMCKMLARFGAQYWAEDLAGLLSNNRSEKSRSGDDQEAWPRGRVLPERQHVSLPARDGAARKPTVSVMIPVYNVVNEGWFHETVDSVLSQDPGPDLCEILIVDDASDNPGARKAAERYGPRVRYVENDANLGLVGNHNRCIVEASGEFVHILHQDDRIKPGFYGALLPVLQKDATLVAGMANVAYIDAEGRTKSEAKAPQERGELEPWQIRLSLQHRIQFPSIIVRRSAYLAVGGFSPLLKFSFDWDMWNRLAAHGPIWFEPQHLAEYRVHKGSATYQFGWLERVEDAMQTVAHMQRLLPADQHRAIAELAMYKFFERYWMLLSEAQSVTLNSDQERLLAFLLKGWASAAESAQIRSKFRLAIS